MISWKDIEKSQETMKVEKEMKRATEVPFLDVLLKIEAESRESSIDSETYLRRKLALAHRWFEYYKREKNHKKKMKLVEQYNRIALMGKQRG